MNDMERYGDYNEIDDSEGKSRLGLAIKIAAIVVCLAVVGLLLFRLFTFNYFPENMKRLYFNDTLTAFYNERDGQIGALTQDIAAKFDDNKEGNFYCDNIIIIPELGQLQLSIRYNDSLEEELIERYGIDSLEREDLSFTLRRSGGSSSATGAAAGEETDCIISVAIWESYLMYEYCKIVIDGIDFGEGEEAVAWLRLDIRIDGVEREEPFMLLVYQNGEGAVFDEYELSDSEVPR